jgi:hypothetical protein
MATMIDTLGYVKKLTAAGMTRELAEAHAEVFRDEVTAQVATKADLDGVKAYLDNKITAVEGKITLLHWMAGFTLAGTMAIFVKLMR